MPNLKIEGYWWSMREPHFPKPEHSKTPFENKNDIVNKLKAVQSNRRVGMTHFKGISTCRCCKAGNGSGEYSYKNWKWPEGLLHYIEAHNVKPSEQFIKEILNM